MSEALAVIRRHRSIYLALVDAICWTGAIVGFGLARFTLDGAGLEEAWRLTPWSALLVLSLVAAAAHDSAGFAVRLTTVDPRSAASRRCSSLGLVTGLVGACVTVLNLSLGRPIPGSVPIAATFGALVCMAWARAFYRAWQRASLSLGAVPGWSNSAELEA